MIANHVITEDTGDAEDRQYSRACDLGVLILCGGEL